MLPSRNFVDDSFAVNGANMCQNQFVLDGADNPNSEHGMETSRSSEKSRGSREGREVVSPGPPAEVVS